MQMRHSTGESSKPFFDLRAQDCMLKLRIQSKNEPAIEYEITNGRPSAARDLVNDSFGGNLRIFVGTSKFWGAQALLCYSLV